MGKLFGPLPAGYSARFEAFWSAYPSRAPHPNPKMQAWAEWRKLGAADHDNVIAAAGAFAAYAADMVRRSKDLDANRFIPHARRWLHGQEWRDWVPAVQEARGARVGEFVCLPVVPEGLLAQPRLRAALMRCTGTIKGSLLEISAPSAFARDHLRGGLSVELKAAWFGSVEIS